MSLLSIVQNVCTDLGLDVPGYVVGNNNAAVKQLLTLANREGQDLSRRTQWKVLRKQNSFTLTTGTKDQGVLNGTVVSAGDFDYFLNETFNNQTLQQPVQGPLSDIDIENYELLGLTGPYQSWYVLGTNLYIHPAPTTADTCQFQYISKHWCRSSGGTGQVAFLADEDTSKLDETLVELGVTWRWLRRKGLDYSEEFQTYEKRVNDAIARDGGARTLYMNSGPMDRSPGIVVPQGNWLQ